MIEPSFRHSVPTHLDTPDGVGNFTLRQVALVVSALVLGGGVGFLAPEAGPRIGDIAVNTPLGWVVQEGQLPVSQIGTSLVPLVGLGVLALPFDPPAEHGLIAWAAYRTQSRMLGPKQIDKLIGSPEVDRDMARVHGGYVAMWDMPSVSMRLASEEARNLHRARWASFLDGIPCPITTILRCTPVDLKGTFARMAKDVNPNGARIAGYLAASTAHGGEVQRRRLLAIRADSDAKLREFAVDIEAALSRATLKGVRLADDALADALHEHWSRRPRKTKRIGPQTMQIESDAIKTEDGWISTSAMQQWPSEVITDFLAPFYDGSDAVDAIQVIRPISKVDVTRKLKNRLSRLESTSETRARRVAIKQLDHTLDQLEQNRERIFATDVYFLVRGSTRAQVKTARKHTQQTAEEIGAQVAELRWEHKAGAVATAGTGEVRLIRRTHKVDTSSQSRAYPWGATELALVDAVPWGVTLHGNRRVLWSPWARPIINNPHIALYGASGSGKGFGLKVYDSRAIFAGLFAESFYTDQAPESEDGEYGRFARYVGGEVRKVEHVGMLVELLEDVAMARPIPRCIVLNTASLSRHDQCRAMVALKRAVWKRAAVLRLPRRLGLDETWVYTEDQEAAAEGEDIVRTGRRMLVSGAFQTQRPMDALNSKLGAIIQSQCATQWFGMQAESEISDVADRLRWTGEQREAISRFGQGEGMLRAGLHRVAFRVDYSPEEWDMAQTDTVDSEPKLQETARHGVQRASVPAVARAATGGPDHLWRNVPASDVHLDVEEDRSLAETV
jgi:hypothetical protein